MKIDQNDSQILASPVNDKNDNFSTVTKSVLQTGENRLKPRRFYNNSALSKLISEKKNKR